MKAAFSNWDNRIAPVFDTAPQLRVVEVESGEIIQETRERLPEGASIQTALRLAELRVGVLVCGAISRQLHALIEAYGIEVIPFVAGELEEVIQAWIGNGLDQPIFAMPGCGLHRQHRHRRGTQNRGHQRWRAMNAKQGEIKSGGGGDRGRRGFSPSE